MTFDLASAVIGATTALITIGGWLVAKLIEAQADIAILTEARDRNADDFVDERTRRMLAENQLDEARLRIRELHHDFPSEGIRHGA